MRREIVSWDEVDQILNHLIVQFDHEFEAMVIITRGGIVPGGMLAEALDITHILTAAVDFPAQRESRSKTEQLLVWPKFIQFPDDELLAGHRVLVVDDVWGSGRTSSAVKNRVSAAGGVPFTCVMHFNPNRNLFGTSQPDYFAASTDAFIIYPWETDQGLDRVLKDY